MLRLGAIGVVLLLLLGAFGYAGGLFTPGQLTPQRFIDQFEAGGVHAGFRRNHAKGVCVSGYFEGNGTGGRYSSAALFGKGRVPVIGRFALAGPQPYLADAPHAVRSMALQFTLPDGERWRTGMNNIPVFPFATPEIFYANMVASNGDTAAKQAFLNAHPETVAAMAIIKAAPTSSGFNNTRFNGLNAFYFVDAQGKKTPVRWSVVPEQPFVAVDDSAPHADKNYLFDALVADIEHAPQHWRLLVTIGEPGDPVTDATKQWPEKRETVDAGTLTINRIEDEMRGPCRDINFDPLVLPKGILPSSDPLLSARSAVYSRSVTARDSEVKQPSAVYVGEAGNE
jgi:catalase